MEHLGEFLCPGSPGGQNSAKQPLPSGVMTLPRQKPEQPLRRTNKLRAEPTFLGVISLFQRSDHGRTLCPALIPLSQSVSSRSVSIKSQLSQDSRTCASLFSLSFLKRKKKKKPPRNKMIQTLTSRGRRASRGSGVALSVSSFPLLLARVYWRP